MNEIQTLDQQIFDFLYKHHLAEKAAGREFYFEIKPKKGSDKPFYWFQNNHKGIVTSFWENNIWIFVTEKYAKFTFLLPNEVFENEIDTDFVAKMGWTLERNYDEIVYHGEYVKKYNYENVEAFLADFIENDSKKINEYFFSKGLLPFSKEKFETRVFEGNFEKDEPLKKINPELQTCLVHLHIQNFKGIKYVKIENIPTNTQWIFLTGENGIGKTLLLQAIALSIFETEEMTDGERKEFINANTRLAVVKYINNNYRIKNIYFDMLGFEPLKYTYKSFAFFGASRLETLINGKTQNKTAHILGKSTQLRNIDNYIFQLRINTLRQNQFHLLKNTICNILNLRDIEIDRRENRTIYFEHDAEKPVPFSQLSAGYKNIINLIGNIVVELSATQMPEITDTTKLTGIVIIDEIEAHLHPKMQRFLVEKLTDLFPKVQFIVSTHSPIPLLGAPKESIILHVDRTREEGITVEKLNIDFQHLLPEAILSSSIFEFDSFLKDTK